MTCTLYLKMSRVPGYEQRLKALLFKGNFNEKITEMKEVLIPLNLLVRKKELIDSQIL